MDQERPFELVLRCSSGIPLPQVFVDFSAFYDRIPHPNAALEDSIEAVWKQRLDSNSSLYNASKFRYGGHQVVTNGSGEVLITLLLGLTDYRTFVGTNLSSHWKEFLSSDTEDTIRCKHTASPLGNGAIVETADSYILTLQRSSNVGEFPGHLVFPGGHSEPEEVGISDYASKHANEELNSKIAKEMFEGIIREVVEETGVPTGSLSLQGDPLFIGISRRVVNVRPTAFFYIRCSLSSIQVLQFYGTAEHAFESTKLCIVSKEDLHWESKRMPGCHQGGAALYRSLQEKLK